MKWTLKKQLVVALLAVGLVPLLFVGAYSSNSTRDAMEKEAELKLMSIRDSKKATIDTYLEGVNGAISVLGRSGDVVTMFKELVQLHKDYKVGPQDPFFITDKHDVKAVYDRFEPTFKKLIEDYKLYDLFIICKPHGHVMYSVAKEPDLGQNISIGELKDSGLAEAWRKTVATEKTSFADLRAYAPSGNAPAMFMATPILDKGEMLGVVAVQLSTDVINIIMTNNTGLGETGQSYLVGPDYLMRSDMIEDLDNYSISNSFKKNNTQKTESVQKALAGESGVSISKDVMGDPVLSAYMPIDFFDVKWAMLVDVEESEVFAPANNIVISMIIITVIMLALIVAIAILLGNYITRPIVESVKSISEASSQVTSASDQIASSATSLAEGATEQASSVEEISAAVETASQLNSKNAESAKTADVLAKESSKSAVDGVKKIEELLKAMSGIIESSQKISKIIKTIDEIAFQTNLLALNAAVEAARAGEHGLGFAVVADEVKNLASRSAQAAKETASIIEVTIDQIKNGDHIAKETNDSFRVIEEKIKRTSGIIAEIAVSVREQAEGMGQVAQSMGQIDSVTQTNAANSEQAAAAAEELNAQAVSMLESVRMISQLVGYDMDSKHHVFETSKKKPAAISRKPQAQTKKSMEF